MTRVLALSAPTASGKSELGLRLAERHGLELVCADAFTVYTRLDVGTAKPDAAARARASHHLLDLRWPWERYDVAQFVWDAEGTISDILARGKTPLVVGGTGFYLSALQSGLPLTPPSTPGGRQAAEEELRERGLDTLLAVIARLNPAEAERLQRNPRRVVRALEVYRATGRFPGDFGRSTPKFDIEMVAFERDPAEFESRVAARTLAMLSGGLIEETRWLADHVPLTHPRPTAWQAIGYPEVLELLEGRASLQQTSERITGATLAYARRQRTWLRTQLKAVIRTPEEAEAELERRLV